MQYVKPHFSHNEQILRPKVIWNQTIFFCVVDILCAFQGALKLQGLRTYCIEHTGKIHILLYLQPPSELPTEFNGNFKFSYRGRLIIYRPFRCIEKNTNFRKVARNRTYAKKCCIL